MSDILQFNGLGAHDSDMTFLAVGENGGLFVTDDQSEARSLVGDDYEAGQLVVARIFEHAGYNIDPNFNTTVQLDRPRAQITRNALRELLQGRAVDGAPRKSVWRIHDFAREFFYEALLETDALERRVDFLHREIAKTSLQAEYDTFSSGERRPNDRSNIFGYSISKLVAPVLFADEAQARVMYSNEYQNDIGGRRSLLAADIVFQVGLLSDEIQGRAEGDQGRIEDLTTRLRSFV